MKHLADLDAVLEAAPRVASLPRDKRGLPIPYVVLKDEHGNPDFIVNDTMVVVQTLTQGLCGVCGQLLEEDDVWFIGGEMSGLHPCGAYNDGPVHHECGQFSLRVCPYLAVRAHTGMKPPAKAGVLQRLLDEDRAVGFVDNTMITDKPKSYILGRATGFIVTGGGGHYRMIPNRPFAELEEWDHGEQIGGATNPAEMQPYRDRGMAMLAASGLTLFTLPDHVQRLWTGGFEGEWPWRQ